MSGLRPFFITGANCKIKLNGKTLAFATDLSYSIQVITQSPKVLGVYEGSSVEPLGYTVSGSFTIVRYAKGIKAASNGTAPNGAAVNDAGNGVGNWGGTWGGGSGLSDFFARNGIGNDGRANEALDPSKFQNGTTFDIQVYQKVPSTAGIEGLGAVEQGLATATNVLQGGTGLGETTDVIGIANIRNCRITQADFSLTKKGVATQRFSFIAQYVDEDSFVADASGRGQQFGGG